MAATPEQAVAVAKQAQLIRALQAEMLAQGSQVDPEVQSATISMQPGVVNPNPRPNGERVAPTNVWSTGNLVPGPSGESKLAATWDPSLDPAAITNDRQKALGWNGFNTATQDPWVG